jgi:hypothetical protein
MDGDREFAEAEDLLGKYGGALITKAVRVDRLTPDHVVIPFVRAVGKDSIKQLEVPGPNERSLSQLVSVEKRGPWRECKPMDCSKYIVSLVGAPGTMLADSERTIPDEDEDATLEPEAEENLEPTPSAYMTEFDVNRFVNDMAAICSPAAPRIARMGDGKGNHYPHVRLMWG